MSSAMSRRWRAQPSPGSVRRRRNVLVACALTALTAASCAALLAAAALVPAPATVLPLVVLVSIGVPMFAMWELSRRIRSMRTPDETSDAGPSADHALEAQAIADLRRALARLPETRHPLDF
jgi:hypothetical protein